MATMPRFRWTGALLVSLVLLSTGCSDRLPTYPVTGKVVFRDGKVARMGSIEFKSREHGIQARGSIQSDGTFKLSTYRDGDGAVAGVHDCVIVQLVIAEGIKHKPSTFGVIHPKYGNYKTTELLFDIQTSPNNLEVIVDGVDPGFGVSNKHEHDPAEKAVAPESEAAPK